jgi:hypothetical protein
MAIGPEVLRILSNSMTTAMPPLLPNLRSINWSRWVISDNESFQHIRLFLGLEINRLKLPINDANVGRLSLLLSLPQPTFPALRKLAVHSERLSYCADLVDHMGPT